MGLSLLAPLFLLALAALAVPILVHLTARDRRDAVRFPSLRFLTRVPYRRERRRRLRHPLIFALRALAVALLAVAFARPLVELGGSATVLGAGREVAIAVDRSYSMAHGDVWERAVAAARDAVDGLRAGTRVSLLTFADEAAVVVAPTTDRGAVARALESLAPGAGGTRFAPALELADEALLDSPAGGREVVLISDFQAHAWDRDSPTGLAPGTGLTAVDVSAAEPANALVADVAVRRTADADGGPSIRLAVRLVNLGPATVRDLPVTAALDGREVGGGRTEIPGGGASATVELGPLAPPPAAARAVVRIGGDRLAADDVFHLVLSPRPAVAVLLVEPDGPRDRSPYLRQALAVAGGPDFEVVVRPASRLRREDVEAATVVILDGGRFPTGAAGRTLVGRVAAGAGLWVILDARSDPDGWPPDAARLLPGRWREAVDRLDGGGVALAAVDYRHPVFEIFAGPDSGNLAAPRFYRYRPIVLAEGSADGDTVARYADGSVALAVGRHGDGRVLLWGSPFDNRWSSLPVEPVFLPFVHRVCRFLAGEREIAPWRRVGEVVDLQPLAEDGDPAAGLVVETPSGRRRLDPRRQPHLRLDEAGFYEIAGRPLAVNVDRAESDLSRLDVEAFVAASTALADPAAPAAAGVRGPSREERERRQGVWWYLVLGALAVLVGESWWSNRTGQGPGRSTASRA